ncbi:unnamed protein product [Durusdinium trenchii]|uniref:Uncharacterized protein n=1 Tax=Durusdinium trenchii TaxID=1381693 RepID=A0ABP0JYQ0_9DINO
MFGCIFFQHLTSIKDIPREKPIVRACTDCSLHQLDRGFAAPPRARPRVSADELLPPAPTALDLPATTLQPPVPASLPPTKLLVPPPSAHRDRPRDAKRKREQAEHDAERRVWSADSWLLNWKTCDARGPRARRRRFIHPSGVDPAQAEAIALQKAWAFRDKLVRQHVLKPESPTVPGVKWDAEKKAWRVQFTLRKTILLSLKKQFQFRRQSIQYITGGLFAKKKYAEREALRLARKYHLTRLAKSVSRLRWNEPKMAPIHQRGGTTWKLPRRNLPSRTGPLHENFFLRGG